MLNQLAWAGVCGAALVHHILNLLLQLIYSRAKLINASQDAAAHGGESICLQAQHCKASASCFEGDVQKHQQHVL